MLLGLSPTVWGRTKEAVSQPTDSAKAAYAYMEAVRLKNMGQRAAAFDLLRHALVLDSTQAAAYSEIAPFYFLWRDNRSGYRALLQAVKYDPDNRWYALAAAQCAMQVKDYTRAEALYAALLQKKPSDMELLDRLTDVCLLKGEPQKALDAYDRFEQQYGANETTILQKARIYHLMQEKERSYEEMERLIAEQPHNTAYITLLGDLYLDAARFDDAWRTYMRVRAIDPDNETIHLSLLNYYRLRNDKEAYKAQADTLLLQSDIDMADKLSLVAEVVPVLAQDTAMLDDLLSRLCERYPNEVDLRKIYSELLVKWDKYDEAQEQVLVALDIAPDEELWNFLFGLLFEKNDNAAVAEYARRAIRENPTVGRYYLIAASTLLQEEDNAEAEKMVEAGLAVPEIIADPLMRSEFLALSADILYRQGSKDEAYARYEEALKYNPQNYGALNNYSYYLAFDGRDLAKAERMSGETVKAEPDNATYLDTYGWVYFRQERYTLARVYLKKAIDLSKQPSAELYEHYGDVLAVTGNEAEAVEWWKKSLAAGGGSELLQRKIAEKKYIAE